MLNGAYHARFEDHRGGESYRPPAPRGYSRHASPTRTRSPRLVADTWVPSPSRHYGRLRSRSPLPFRRHSRSPPYRHRDSEPGLFTNSAPRRFSPRRDARLRSPQIGWRPRSPYGDRPRDTSSFDSKRSSTSIPTSSPCITATFPSQTTMFRNHSGLNSAKQSKFLKTCHRP